MTRQTINRLLVIVALLSAAAGVAIYFQHSGKVEGSALATHEWALTILPEETAVVIATDIKSLATIYSKEMEKVLGVRLDDEETRKEIGAFVMSRTGIDPFQIEEAAFFVVKNRAGFVFKDVAPAISPTLLRALSSQEDEYNGYAIHKIESGFYATVIGQHLFLGEKKALRACIDVAKGERKALVTVHEGALHGELARRLGTGLSIMTIVPDHRLKEELRYEIAPELAVDSLGLVVTGKQVIGIVRGDEPSRKLLLQKIEEFKTSSLKSVQNVKTNVVLHDTPESLLAIVLSHALEPAFQRVQPREMGDFLVLEADFQALTAGYLAAVGVLTSGFYLTPSRLRSETRRAIMDLEMAVIVDYARHGEYPEKLPAPERGGRKYIKTQDPMNDFWGTEFLYTITEHGFKICSAGPDRLHHTADDICGTEGD